MTEHIVCVEHTLNLLEKFFNRAANITFNFEIEKSYYELNWDVLVYKLLKELNIKYNGFEKLIDRVDFNNIEQNNFHIVFLFHNNDSLKKIIINGLVYDKCRTNREVIELIHKLNKEILDEINTRLEEAIIMLS